MTAWLPPSERGSVPLDEEVRKALIEYRDEVLSRARSNDMSPSGPPSDPDRTFTVDISAGDREHVPTADRLADNPEAQVRVVGLIQKKIISPIFLELAPPIEVIGRGFYTVNRS